LVCAAAAVLLASAAPARADSYTWGYGYARDRATAAELRSDAPPAAGSAGAAPYVVPLPGSSQSTPVVVAGTWYLWTYWDGGQRGALWTGRLLDGAAASTPGTAIVLPGAPGPVLSAGRGSIQRFDEPSDAAVSPDGRWVAFGAGDRLYWWPSGVPQAGNWAEVAGPAHVAANSTSPTFVPDGAVASGWDVCDGNWDGGFACFPVTPRGVLPQPTAALYQVDWTAAADADGYAAITSSAAYGGPLSDLYFGVASPHDPRLIAMDPRSGRYAVLGSGQVGAPVSAAVAVLGASVYATDAAGTAYRFSASSGRLDAARALPGGAVDIASPAVDAKGLYVLADGRAQVVRLDPGTLVPLNEGPANPSAPSDQASAVTLVGTGDASPEVVWATGAGGVRISVDPPTGAASGAGIPGFQPVAALPGAPGSATYNFTAPVVDGDDILLWSDAASTGWAASVAPSPAAPAGLAPPAGGLEIYRLPPRMSAFVRPSPARAGGPAASLLVLAPPGAAVTAEGSPWGRLAMEPVAEAGPACKGPGGPGLGMFPPPSAGGAPAAGCGALAGQFAALAEAAAAGASQPHPPFAGATPAAWQAAGAPFTAFAAPLPVPGTATALAIRVAVTAADGDGASATVWLTTRCPAGWARSPEGTCAIPLSPAPDPWLATGGLGPPPADRCPPSLVPGRDGWTAREYDLLCAPLGAWLVDPAVVACAGSWWNRVSRGPVAEGCGPGAAGGGASRP
jgi:hypothetical protein